LSTATIPGHSLEAPSEKAAIEALSELVGLVAGKAIWAAAVQNARVTSPVTRIDDLAKVAEELTKISDGLGRVSGRSLKIRVMSYMALSGKVSL
jgi:hypothetical protein